MIKITKYNSFEEAWTNILESEWKEALGDGNKIIFNRSVPGPEFGVPLTVEYKVCLADDSRYSTDTTQATIPVQGKVIVYQLGDEDDSDIDDDEIKGLLKTYAAVILLGDIIDEEFPCLIYTNR